MDAGADAIVAVSAIFKSHDYAAAILNLRQSAMRRA